MNVLSQYWYPVSWSKDVSDKPVSVKLLDQPLEPKLQENLKSRGYNVDLRTATADLDKLVQDEFYKYNRFGADELSWKAQ